jgi:dihydroxynaphthoic acid synthetase
MPDFADIRYDIDRGVATLTIDRPASLNAFTGRTLEELASAVRAAGANSAVGVIVLTGSGERAFCAGGDINWETTDEFADGPDVLMNRLYQAMREVFKPTIARVNGYAIGGGNHLAYFCDLTIAAEHAVFGQNGPMVASPAQGWIVSYLTRVVGAKRAHEMWMLCERYRAKQMLDWGLVNSVVPLTDLDAEVRRWCDKLLALSPTVIKLVRHSFDEEWSALRADERDLLADVNPGFFESGEQAEGANAFLEKRQPQFDRWR